MQKIIIWVLIGLGAFLLVAALIASLWAPGVVKKTPIDTDSTTHLSGTAAKLNPGTGKVEDLQVKATSFTKADSDASDDDVVVFTNVTCLVVDGPDVPDCIEDKNDPNLINIPEPDAFATDRYDAGAVENGTYVPEGTEQKEGLVNKFPFDTEKKSYDYWDGMIGEPVKVDFKGTHDIEGVETYEFNYNVSDVDAEVVDGIDGKYSMDKTMWIEPRTGAIVKQEQHEVRTLENGDPLLDLNLAFTDDQVKTNAEDAEENVSSLELITSTVPLVGFIVGPILLIVGGGLLLLSRTKGRRSA
ncbi:DUF3068 domain-containing protein [Nocardioides sp. JQ2195]|uniref:DUF3068 domain-containing protein n=1 Tax=Nocardioides sp. JQ2195 TaxID=2592334 RepID=UPI00143EEAD4|nr:DUF3068 domain-containing protein [Nocardioides sp. JQ2195]QIX26419.1 DUF3068 domain-containing protein [Nocardioides sp. JQ2195]